MLFILGNCRVPFPLLCLHTFQKNHVHSDRSGLKWTEKMTLRACVQAIDVRKLRRAVNDNLKMGA